MGSLGPADLNPADVDGLMALHAATTQGTWVVLPGIHEHTRVGVKELGPLRGLVATASTNPADYGQANAAWIAAAHRLLPALAAELTELRQQLAGHPHTSA